MTLDPGEVLALLAIVGGLELVLAAAVMLNRMANRRFRRRLRAIYERAAGTAAAGAENMRRSLTRTTSPTPTIDRVARRWLPRRERLATRLARTGRNISIGQYALTSIAIALVGASAVTVLTPLGPITSTLIGLCAGLALPHIVIGRLGKRRVAAFIDLFPEAIDLMVRALRSGLPVSEAIIDAGREIPDPVGCELRLVESGMRLGRDLEALLWDIAKRIDATEFRFFIIAMSVHRETGGNLAETLANLADALRRRRQMRAKVRAMSSETRATTMILGGLPIVVIGLLALTSPDYLRPLFYDKRGYFLDALAIGMLITGISVMNRMAKFEI
jgi:tight adherence protein B